ncbi:MULTISPECIES: hypothetical protein [unclassified Methylobacterium]|jgi:hypothetical protein|uniref:hypothetical protein n=1 Tax=unclassified Methylobacterium TaxID=2615210 RepID=UPI001353101F|nr:hypothetical protein [Methylobacterium sp. 2A]MWV24963.1 hypothetical protein [Methylobacterium sp. 2A]
MPDLDLRTAFAQLCADMSAGDTAEAAYEETLRIAVQRLGRRTRDPRAHGAALPLSGLGSPEPDCPFMISITALPGGRPQHGAH